MAFSQSSFDHFYFKYLTASNALGAAAETLPINVLASSHQRRTVNVDDAKCCSRKQSLVHVTSIRSNAKGYAVHMLVRAAIQRSSVI